MAEVAVFLDAEPARLSPRQRLVVPKAARIKADVPPDRPHVTENGRGDGLRRFDKNGIVLAQESRVLDLRQRSQRPDFSSLLGFADAFQFRDAADIENVFRLEKLLPHGWKKIGAPRKNSCGAGALARVFAKKRNGLGERMRARELEVGEAHAKGFTTEDTEVHREVLFSLFLNEPLYPLW